MINVWSARRHSSVGINPDTLSNFLRLYKHCVLLPRDSSKTFARLIDRLIKKVQVALQVINNNAAATRKFGKLHEGGRGEAK